jgi:hypothetical protein
VVEVSAVEAVWEEDPVLTVQTLTDEVVHVPTVIREETFSEQRRDLLTE